MEQATTIGLDLAKNVLQVHGVDASGKVVLRRKLRRAVVLEFFAALPPALVGMEACGGAHCWARKLTRFGHTVRLMPPAYAEAYVTRSKTDAAEAEAICEAVTRPTRRFVPLRPRSSRRAKWSSRCATCWCASVLRPSMRCAPISPNTVSLLLKGARLPS